MTGIVIGLHNKWGEVTWMHEALFFVVFILVVICVATFVTFVLMSLGREVAEKAGYHWTKGRLRAERHAIIEAEEARKATNDLGPHEQKLEYTPEGQ